MTGWFHVRKSLFRRLSHIPCRAPAFTSHSLEPVLLHQALQFLETFLLHGEYHRKGAACSRGRFYSSALGAWAFVPESVCGYVCVALILNTAGISCSKRCSRMLSSTLLLLSWQPLMSLQHTLVWWVNRPLILWYFSGEKYHCVSLYQLSFLSLPRVSMTDSLLKVSIQDNGSECML